MIPWEQIESDERYSTASNQDRINMKLGWFKENIEPTEQFQSLEEPARISMLNNFFAEETRTAPEQPTEEPGYAKTFAQGVARGTEGLMGSVGSAMRWAGDVTGSETLSDQGEMVSDYWGKEAKEGWEAQDPRTFGGSFTENPSVKRAVGIIGEAAPSMVVGGGFGAAGRMIGLKALGLGPKAAATFGGASGGTVLGMSEGAVDYEAAREAGKTVGEASAVGLSSGIGTAILEAIPIGRMLAFKGGRVVSGLKGGVEEAGQEATQTVWQNIVAKVGYDESRNLAEGIIESIIGGAGTGAPMGVLLSNNGVTQEEYDQAKTEIQGQVKDHINKETISGVSDLAETGEVSVDDIISVAGTQAASDMGLTDDLNRLAIEKQSAKLDNPAALREEIRRGMTVVPSQPADTSIQPNMDFTYRVQPVQPSMPVEKERATGLRGYTGEEFVDVHGIEQGSSPAEHERPKPSSIEQTEPAPTQTMPVQESAIPEPLRQSFGIILNEALNTETRGTSRDDYGNVIGYSASSPPWMTELNSRMKKAKQPLFSRSEISNLISKSEQGKELTDKQEARFSYLSETAEMLNRTHPDLVSQQDANDMESQGYELIGGQKITGMDLEKGDKFIGEVDGIKDEFEHKGFDKKGNIVLQDGVEKRIDPFDQVVVDGLKRTEQKAEDQNFVDEPEDIGKDPSKAKPQDLFEEPKPNLFDKPEKISKQQMRRERREKKTSHLEQQPLFGTKQRGLPLGDSKPADIPTQEAKPVQESVQPEIVELESIFIRKPTNREKVGGTARSRGFNKFPEAPEGYEKVYKPYGEEGAGYYYQKIKADQAKESTPLPDVPETPKAEPKAKEIADLPTMDEMVVAASRWRGAALNYAEGLDKKGKFKVSKQTTKGDLDAYLMRRFGVDEITARDVSNELTRKNIPDDRTAEPKDYIDEPWQQQPQKSRQEKNREKREELSGDIQKDAYLIKSAKDAVEWVKKYSKNKSYQVIANRIKSFIGNDIRFVVVDSGVVITGGVPAALHNAKGVYYDSKETGKVIYVRGKGFEESGLSDETMLHELIHAATIEQIREGNLVKNKDTDLSKAVTSLYALQKRVADVISEKIKNNTATEFEKSFRTMSNASSVDELVANGLTSKEFQDMLRGIKYNGNRTAWSRFVNALKRILGLDNTTALDEIIQVTDDILSATGGKKRDQYSTKRVSDTPAFKNWFKDSKVVDENGEPLVVYSGHSNIDLWGTKYNPKIATAGGFYTTSDPKIASSYAMGKLGVKEYHENGGQYRFKLKNGKWGKKLWQIELTKEQIDKIEELKSVKNEYGDSEYPISEMDSWIEQNKNYDKDARSMSYRGGSHNLFNIWKFYENMGYTIAYSKEGDAPITERQQQNQFEDLLDELGIAWQSYDWAQPGVMSLYLSIKNPLDTSKPIPTEVMNAIKKKASRERDQKYDSDSQWTKEYPLKQWVKDIENDDGNHFWATQIPQKAMPILRSFGYDGIKDVGGKSGNVDKHAVWIAFEPTQIKSATGNRGTFDQNNPDIRYATSNKPQGSVTIKDVQSLLSGAIKNYGVRAGLSTDGKIWVRTPDGFGATIENVEWIDADTVAFEMGRGRMMKDGEIILGKHKNGHIQISKVGGKWTVTHEMMGHWLEHIGKIDQKDINLLRREIIRRTRQGKFTPENENDIGGAEDRANFIADQLNAEIPGRVGQVIAKVREFLDRLVNLFKRTSGGVLRDIKSGKIFERTVNGRTYQTTAYDKTAERWFSQLEKSIEGIKQEIAPASQWKAMIAKLPVKQEELEWVGLNEWLDIQDGKVSKQDILDKVRENNVQIEEVVKGKSVKNEYAGFQNEGDGTYSYRNTDTDEIIGIIYKNPYGEGYLAKIKHKGSYSEIGAFSDLDSAKVGLAEAESELDIDETKFSQYQEPGGENYKELLLTMPGKPELSVVKHPSMDGWALQYPDGSYVTSKDGGATTEKTVDHSKASLWSQKEYINVGLKMHDKTIYKSTHFDEPNILAHVRFNERTGPNGERVLFLEEIQSDLHQDGRKKGYQKTYRESDLPEGRTVEKTPSGKYIIVRDSIRMTPAGKEFDSKQDAIGDYVTGGYYSKEKGMQIPDAPFKKSWPLLTIKRMVRYAAENGFDSIAWTPGEIQADRYDLSKQVQSIQASKKTDGSYYLRIYPKASALQEITVKDDNELSNTVGKELAEKISKQPVSNTKIFDYDGVDLKVGGEGMKGFYDKILPAEVNKFFGKKAWGGARVGRIGFAEARTSNFETNWENDVKKYVVRNKRTNEPLASFERTKEAEEYRISLEEKMEAHALPITPGMKSKALREGMPMFSSKVGDQYSVKTINDYEKHISEGIQEAATKWKKNKKPDLALLDTIISTPLYHWTETDKNGKPKIEALHRMYNHAVESQDDYYEEFFGLTHSTEGESMIAVGEQLLKTRPDEYRANDLYLKHRDMNQVGYKLKNENDAWTIYNPDGKKISTHENEEDARFTQIRNEVEDRKNGKWWKDEIDLAKEILTDEEYKLLINQEVSDLGAKWLESVRVIQDRGFEKYMVPAREFVKRAKQTAIDKGYAVQKLSDKFTVWRNGKQEKGHFETEEEAWDSVVQYPKVVYEDEKGEKTQINYRVALSMMGDRRGYYMPRIRKPGRLALLAKKDGLNPVREHFDMAVFNEDNQLWKDILNAPTSIQRRARELKRKGYSVEIVQNNQVSEDVFEMLAPSLGAFDIVNKAMEKTGTIKGIDSLKAMGMKSTWRGKDFYLTGALFKQGHDDMLKDLGGKYSYKSEKGKYGTPQWKFENAPGNIEEKISQRIFEFENINPDFESKFTETLGLAIAEIIKGRGSRSHMLARDKHFGKGVWAGYETDSIQAVGTYAKSIAAGEAKRHLAINMVKDFTGTWETWAEYKQRLSEEGKSADYAEYKNIVRNRRVDSSTQKNAYKEGKAFIQDVLRNQEATERVLGVLKGAAVLKFLAFRVFSAPLVNLTALPTSAVASLVGHGKMSINQAFRNITSGGRHYVQYRMEQSKGTPRSESKLSKEINQLFDDMKRKGWYAPQYDKEGLSVLRSKSGRVYQKLIDVGMYTFAGSESFNRGATIAGAFIGLRKQGVSYEDALKKAKEISDNSHGVYHKANIPHIARGGHWGSQALKSFYMFKTFSHNYLLNMKKLGLEKEYKALSWMVLSPAVLAGAGASIMTPVISQLFKAFGYEDDPEEELYSAMENAFGSTGETIGRNGLFGLLNMNLKGSLSIDVGVGAVPTTFKEFLGAPAGVISDLVDSTGHFIKGDYLKSAEKALPLGFGNLVKSYREGTEGPTTMSGAPIFYGDKQLEPSVGDTMIRALGFNPSGLSGKREKQWKEKLSDQNYAEQRADIYFRLRKFFMLPVSQRTQEKYAEILIDIQSYNDKVRSRGLADRVPVLTDRAIKTNLKRSFTPNKTERNRSEK